MVTDVVMPGMPSDELAERVRDAVRALRYCSSPVAGVISVRRRESPNQASVIWPKPFRLAELAVRYAPCSMPDCRAMREGRWLIGPRSRIAQKTAPRAPGHPPDPVLIPPGADVVRNGASPGAAVLSAVSLEPERTSLNKLMRSLV